MYTLLKASDFVVHDLSAESVFEGCVNNDDDGHDEPEHEHEHDQDTRCESAGGYRLELVLRKWFVIDPSREMRAFVRDGVLIGAWRYLHPSIYIYICRSHAHLGEKRTKNENATGISQRDANHYEFLNEPETQSKIVSSFVAHWTAHVKPKWTGPASCK